MLKKLKSRKLWACLAGLAVGLAQIFGLDQGTVSAVSGAVTALASVVTYIVTEGKIDIAALPLVQQAGDAVAKAVEAGKEDPCV